MATISVVVKQAPARTGIAIEPGVTLTEEQMHALENAKRYTTFFAHIGGYGEVLMAEAKRPYIGPRYEFDNMRRVWMACG